MQSMNVELNNGRPGLAHRWIPGQLLSYGRLVLQPLVRNEQIGESRRSQSSRRAVSGSRA